MNNIEVQKEDVEIIDITEDGSIRIEKGKDYLMLFFEDQEVDLNQSFDSNGLTLSQGENAIAFENEDQMSYFQEQLKLKDHK